MKGTKYSHSVRRVPICGYAARMARYSRSPTKREIPAGPLAGRVTDVTPKSLRHAHITLMHELGIDDRTNKRYHGHKQEDVQGVHYIRRYDVQLLKAAQTVADAYDEAAEYVMSIVLDWDIDTSIFE